MFSQFGRENVVSKGRNNLKIVVCKFSPFYIVWADLPRPMGERAPAWGKLAHLESIHKTNIYSKLYEVKGFSSVYIYMAVC